MEAVLHPADQEAEAEVSTRIPERLENNSVGAAEPAEEIKAVQEPAELGELTAEAAEAGIMERGTPPFRPGVPLESMAGRAVIQNKTAKTVQTPLAWTSRLLGPATGELQKLFPAEAAEAATAAMAATEGTKAVAAEAAATEATVGTAGTRISMIPITTLAVAAAEAATEATEVTVETVEKITHTLAAEAAEAATDPTAEAAMVEARATPWGIMLPDTRQVAAEPVTAMLQAETELPAFV